MTEDQKSKFCDEYCKFADEANRYITAARNCANGKALQELIDYANRKLSDHCEKCLLDEVSHE